MRAGVNGAAGQMGRLLCELLGDERVSATGRRAGPGGVVALGPGAHDHAEVVIDFSLPEGTDQLLDCLSGQALVIGTTGLSQATLARVDAYALRAPVLRASNFSTGVTVLLDLVGRAAAALPDYDLEIVEMHHRRKRDAPSGTALSLGRSAELARGRRATVVHGREGVVGPRPDGEVGYHAVRGGDVAGEHSVYLAGPGERLLLGHLATSRQAFAAGAIRAARGLVGRPPGLVSFAELLGLAD